MSNTPKPTEINLHKASHVLEIAFNDGSRFNLPTSPPDGILDCAA